MNKYKKTSTMKTIYKSIFVIGLGILSLTASAQKDSTFTRQVLLQRDYNPTMQDASKINTLPSIYTPEVKTKEFKFVSSAPQVKLSNNQLGSAEPGDIRTNVDFSRKRGYINLAGGTHGNLEGVAGVRILNTNTDRLDFFGTHTSTSGTVDYIDGSRYIMDDVKAKHSASKINLKYMHHFEPSILSFDASFFNTSYNYYGNSFLPNTTSAFPFDINSKQNVNVFSIGAGLKSSINNKGDLKYDGNIRYQNFKSKYGPITKDDAPKGGQLDVNLDFNAELGADKFIGVKGYVMNQSFSNDSQIASGSTDPFHSFTNITATPYAKFQGESWNVTLGVNASALFDVKNKVHISPDFRAEIRLYDVNVFYGEVTGGVNNNTFLDILMENRYADPISRIDYSKTLFDIKAGFKSGVVNGLEFDIFAGYKKTDKDHLYLAGSTNTWANVSEALYADVSTGHIGGSLKTTLIPYTDLSAKITGYFYDVKYVNGYMNPIGEAIPEKEAWGRPSFKAELNADVKPIDKVTISLNYLYAGGRKTYLMSGSENRTVNMKDINELNFRGEYQITDWVSVNARLNNILFQKYELQYGYPLQGFNVLGGVSFNF